MEFLNSKKFIITMLIVLVCVSIQACSPVNGEKVNHPIPQEKDKVEDEGNPGPTDFSGIADALGCVFAPVSYTHLTLPTTSRV